MAKFDPTSTATGAELLPRAGDAEATIHVPTSAAYYEAAIEGLTKQDELMLRAAPFPPIYESGVGYRKEERDTWRHADDVLCSGWGDCEDLAAWRAAELRVSGEDPDARVYVYQSAPRRFHAVVARGDGSLEDPSIKLGMQVSEARRQTLPTHEGESEMANEIQPRQFAACSGTCGEDMLSRGAVGEAGVLLTDPPGASGFLSSLGRTVRRVARPSVPFGGGRMFGGGRVVGRVAPLAPFMASGVEDDGNGDLSVLGSVEDLQDQMLAGAPTGGDENGGTGEVYDDGYGYGYDDGYGYGDDTGYEDASMYSAEDGGTMEETAPAEPSGPNPLEQAAAAAGRGIKSAASAAWDTTKDVFLPIKYGVQTAVAPIKMVKNVSQKAAKYLQAPVKAVNKLFSFLGGIDEVCPEQIGMVDDDDYVPGDENFWDDGSDRDDGDEEAGQAPLSQRPRWRTDEVSPGIWQGQFILPTQEPGKAITLTTTPAPDEASAAERMYNLTKYAANSPAMMALTNPLAFALMMTFKGADKVPFGSMFKAVGSGVTSAARAVGRTAETVARSAASW